MILQISCRFGIDSTNDMDTIISSKGSEREKKWEQIVIQFTTTMMKYLPLNMVRLVMKSIENDFQC